MDIQFGLENEIGITRERPEGIDVVAESIALVRSATVPGVRSCWDYGREDPHRDARGFRVAALRQDTDEANYFAQDASRPLSFAEIKSDLVLRNGARFYNDHAHPEYCTPECSTVRELLRQDAAGDRLLMECAAAVSRDSDNPVRLYKNNTDFLGHSYGCHENYLLPRDLGWAALASGIQAFLVTRQIYAGAGKYGWEDEDRFLHPGFQLAQRSDFFTELQSVDTMQRRPLINTRDEPHADPARFRRFHVIIGDSNLSPFATYLKVGTTALVLRALAAGVPGERIPRLADPLGALSSISRDLSWKWELRTSAGRATAVTVQRAYRDLALEFAPPLGPEDAGLYAEWGAILDDLEREPASTSDRLDWTAKYRLIEGFRESEGIAADDPWLRSLDLAYHGSFRLPFPDEPEAPAELRPPETTRAALRGGCIEKFGPLVESAQWDGVVLKAAGGGRIELDLRGVFDRTQVDAGRAALAAARTPEDLLGLPFAKRI